MIGRQGPRPCGRHRSLAAVSVLAAAAAILAGEAGAQGPPPRKRDPYRPKLLREGDLVRHPVWGVEISVPGFKDWSDHPMSRQANWILGAQSGGACELNLTMFVEITKEGAAPGECREAYVGDPDRVRKTKGARLIEHQAGPLTYTRFDMEVRLGAGRLVQNQLYGYWTRGEHCFELHVSAVECGEPFDGQAMPILRSVRILEDTGATLETVSLALRFGGDPRDWDTHLAAATMYLYQDDKPERARRFYESALRLGGDEQESHLLWGIHEGIGLSWLMQDQGREALEPLRLALADARAAKEPVLPEDWEGPRPTPVSGMIEETLTNLACAHSLIGEIDEACRFAREALAAVPPEARPSSVEEMRKDKQLKPLRKSACFKGLLRELGLD